MTATVKILKSPPKVSCMTAILKSPPKVPGMTVIFLVVIVARLINI